jgi:hypothetical protein
MVADSGETADLVIRMAAGSTSPPADAVKVFGAPYIEEIDGMQLKRSDNFWNVYKCNNYIYLEAFFPHPPEERKALLRLSKESREWLLYTGEAVKEADPMEYPLDGLILYYLSALSGDIMIHASGSVLEGKGYLFSGRSGRGKTTMARLCGDAGAFVIHDDRLIIRKKDGRYKMFNTPVYRNDDPREAVLNLICLLDHGQGNKAYPVGGAEAVSLVLSNCIQHGWDRELVAKLLASVSDLCSKIPVVRLEFVPDKSVAGYLIDYEAKRQ